MLKDLRRILFILIAMSVLSEYANAEEQSVRPELKLIGLALWDDTENAKDEARDQAWSFSIDNDLFVPSSRDQDYTFGLSAASSTEFRPTQFWSVDAPLKWLNSKTGLDSLKGKPRTYSTEFGLYAFTPEDLSNDGVDVNDRPYSSLLYVSNSREFQGKSPDLVWRSTLTVGALGLRIAGDLQNEVHGVIGSDRAEGWGHQISDGGELTARYSIARQRLWTDNNSRFEVKTSAQASLGYITEVSTGVSVRFGNIVTRWQSFNPELATYREHSVPVLLGTGYEESYFSTGFAIKARAYNAFLQGQFRDSNHSLSGGELNHGIVEAWAGYTHIFSNGYRINYSLRGHTSEVKNGDGDRTVLWGGLSVARAF